MIGLVELNKLNATTYFVFPREERYFVKPIFNMIKQEYYEVSNYFEYKITDTMRKIIRYIEDKAEIILSSNKFANIVYTENNSFYHYSTNDIDDEKQQKEFIDIVDDKSEKILYLASIKMENGKIEYFLNKKIGKRIMFLSKGNISTCFLLENNGSYNVLPFKDEYKDEK